MHPIHTDRTTVHKFTFETSYLHFWNWFSFFISRFCITIKWWKILHFCLLFISNRIRTRESTLLSLKKSPSLNPAQNEALQSEINAFALLNFDRCHILSEKTSVCDYWTDISLLWYFFKRSSFLFAVLF